METREQVAAQIRKEFAEFLAKWNMEISVVEGSCGYATTVDGIEFSWDGVYTADGDTLREFGSVNIGNWASKDNV